MPNPHTLTGDPFVADKINEGNTLQTAASKPHGGISLYRDILANVLENGQTSEQVQNSQSSICENSESVISDKEKAQKKLETNRKVLEMRKTMLQMHL